MKYRHLILVSCVATQLAACGGSEDSKNSGNRQDISHSRATETVSRPTIPNQDEVHVPGIENKDALEAKGTEAQNQPSAQASSDLESQSVSPQETQRQTATPGSQGEYYCDNHRAVDITCKVPSLANTVIVRNYSVGMIKLEGDQKINQLYILNYSGGIVDAREPGAVNVEAFAYSTGDIMVDADNLEFVEYSTGKVMNAP
ncbi:hypothetical protein [Pseudobacteriovorax antillogorgiicola]|uniref:Uncharacterized protein n=1 Tax=Pseudobacteriovorax antillogorgiicola TaxID=1513793 RepID=A0A1Y6CPB8_9BACT|nr:hypothetical protein [Pseudobacteriovorax antillogorgiicola]TCS46359.1 hypothetical protein EDD56_12423 [Pseudobacteriovorax antillogorgiicola]SMF68413.1 hypothetical protein SAMN06296036_12423 [Pseudobacteriovorax antillogorgiicola]